MNVLTKENFWNQLKEKYPLSVQHFCDWIDQYKKENQWERLFNYGSPHYDKMGWHNPKFHDLPMEMQYGIILYYFLIVHQFCFAGTNWETSITLAFKQLNETMASARN